MDKVTMMGTFTCQDGKGEEMESVLAAMVEAAKGEPGPGRRARPGPLTMRASPPAGRSVRPPACGSV